LHKGELAFFLDRLGVWDGHKRTSKNGKDCPRREIEEGDATFPAMVTPMVGQGGVVTKPPGSGTKGALWKTPRVTGSLPGMWS
jgi:hypothetical protein